MLVQASRAGHALPAWTGQQLTIVADASIYYKDDLRRRLGAGRRLNAPGLSLDSPEEAIALAYNRWGADLAQHLEGDFAFVLWDAETRTLVAARDFAGSRPLFWTALEDGLEIASSARRIRAGREDVHPLDPVLVAAGAAGLSLANGEATAFSGIHTLLAGHTLVWRPGQTPVARPHWSPPPWRPSRAGSFDDAAKELRGLLFASVKERLSANGTTAIALSGGWDSTAIFGAARALIEAGDVSSDTVQVSIAYPPDDPGHEDDLIRMALDRWGASTTWIDSEEIQLFESVRQSAEERDRPMAHLFESWNRRLVKAAGEAGADVMFTGYGGDQLFQVSDVYMADLLRGGRWIRLLKEWRAKGGSGPTAFFRWAVLPLLPEPLVSVMGLMRGGRRPIRYLERQLPPWMDRKLARKERLAARDRQYLAPRGMRRAEAEAHWYLTNPFFPAVNSWVSGFGADAGVEVRAPLYDSRLVDFQAGRPWSDRSWEAETKVLLRQALVGLLPAELLAPRPYRTGVTSTYARRQMAASLPSVVRRLQEDGLRLADLGVIDGDRYCRYALDAFEGRAPELELTAFMTLSAELWVRELDGAAAPATEDEHAKEAEVIHG